MEHTEIDDRDADRAIESHRAEANACGKVSRADLALNARVRASRVDAVGRATVRSEAPGCLPVPSRTVPNASTIRRDSAVRVAIIGIMFRHLCVSLACVAASLVPAVLHAQSLSTPFRWKSGPPVQAPAARSDDPCVSVKDPTIVRHEGRWHLFTTIRSEKRTHQIEYSSFAEWGDAAAAPRQILTFNSGYFCAPQVFYFTPHRKWYLLHQAADPSRPVALQPAFSTTNKIGDPTSWSAPEFLFERHPENVKAWIDFWVICDETKAHLFFTSNNGLMWRAETALADFPRGWSQPAIVLRDDIFEASHTYRLRGANGYLTLVEAQNGLRRYYKAYVADRLDGEWKPLAATKEQPFASDANVEFAGEPWAQSISHGELIRAGIDEKLEIDPNRLQFLFQGARDDQMRGVPYGRIPWRLGLLEAVRIGAPGSSTD